MDNWEKLKIGVASGGVVLVIGALRGITGLVFPETYVARPAYRVAGVDELAVDLVSLQRSWPAGLSTQGGRGNVRAFMSNIEKVSVPRSAEAPAVAAPQPQLDLGTLLAQANADKGRQTAQVCTSCHSFDQGGENRVGPGLWNVVGRKVASHAAFSYSGAFMAQTGDWTYERLDKYLASPARAIPGNKMGFNGLRRAEDRANVIAYLSTLSASPVPFPRPQKPKVAEAAPPKKGS
jgi:cytochrome c